MLQCPQEPGGTFPMEGLGSLWLLSAHMERESFTGNITLCVQVRVVCCLLESISTFLFESEQFGDNFIFANPILDDYHRTPVPTMKVSWELPLDYLMLFTNFYVDDFDHVPELQ